MPNAAPQLRPKAVAKRRLEGVSCRRLFGAAVWDARRALLSRFVLEHRLAPKDPLEPEEAAWEGPAIAALLEGSPVPLARVAAFLAV